MIRLSTHSKHIELPPPEHGKMIVNISSEISVLNSVFHISRLSNIYFFNPTRQYRLDKRRSASIIKIFVSFDNWVKHTIRSRQKRNFHAGGNERTSINAKKSQTPRKINADFSQGRKTQKNRWWKSTLTLLFRAEVIFPNMTRF